MKFHIKFDNCCWDRKIKHTVDEYFENKNKEKDSDDISLIKERSLTDTIFSIPKEELNNIAQEFIKKGNFFRIDVECEMFTGFVLTPKGTYTYRIKEFFDSVSALESILKTHNIPLNEINIKMVVTEQEHGEDDE